MTAYNKTELVNLLAQQQALDALRSRFISQQSHNHIITAHPITLYTPNVFVKIGLGILTLFIVLASMGLMFMLFSVSSGFALSFAGIICYAVLEFMTRTKKHYNSGVDNVLMALAPIFFIAGIGFETHNAETVLSFLALLCCVWLTLRFADSFFAVAAVLSLFVFIFNLYVGLGEFTISTYPYILIILAAATYWIARSRSTLDDQLIYQHCWQMVTAVSIIALYAFGNVYFIEQLTNDNFLLQKNSPLNVYWFFWSWTILMPVAFLIFGFKKRDLLHLRLGVILFAAGILTFRYYHTILPVEIALLIAGAILIAVSYRLIKYLRSPKHGFVFAPIEQASETANDAEALIIGEAFGDQPAVAEESGFGGGSFGGAGAGSSY